MFSYSNWSVLTVNFLVVLYLALGGVTLSAILHLAGARWRYEVRLLASSLFALFPLAFVLERNQHHAIAGPGFRAVDRVACQRRYDVPMDEIGGGT